MQNILSGNTLLHEAVINKKPKIVKLLLENGINKSLKNYNGENTNDLNESIIKSENDYSNENSIYFEIHELLK